MDFLTGDGVDEGHDEFEEDVDEEGDVDDEGLGFSVRNLSSWTPIFGGVSLSALIWWYTN